MIWKISEKTQTTPLTYLAKNNMEATNKKFLQMY